MNLKDKYEEIKKTPEYYAARIIHDLSKKIEKKEGELDRLAMLDTPEILTIEGLCIVAHKLNMTVSIELKDK